LICPRVRTQPKTANDLVQDTLVRALHGEHLFNGGDLRTWLFTILLNLDQNRRRGFAHKPFLTVIENVDSSGDLVADSSPTISDAVWRSSPWNNESCCRL